MYIESIFSGIYCFKGSTGYDNIKSKLLFFKMYSTVIFWVFRMFSPEFAFLFIFIYIIDLFLLNLTYDNDKLLYPFICKY